MQDYVVISDLSSAEGLNDARSRCVGLSIIVCENGHVEIASEGGTITLRAGQVMVLPYRSELSGLSVSRDAAVQSLTISNLYLLKFIPLVGRNFFLLYKELAMKPVDISSCSVLAGLIKTLEGWKVLGVPEDQSSFVDSTVCSVISALMNGMELPPADTAHAPELLFRFIELVESGDHVRHYIDQYAGQLNVSGKVLKKEIFRAFGCNAQDVLDYILVQQIISDSVDGRKPDFRSYGFSSQSNMSHFVKRTTGLNLSDIRKTLLRYTITIGGAVTCVILTLAVLSGKSETGTLFHDVEALTISEQGKPRNRVESRTGLSSIWHKLVPRRECGIETAGTDSLSSSKTDSVPDHVDDADVENLKIEDGNE